MPRIRLRVGVVQFAPKLGQVQANLKKARDLCKQITPHSVDLLCLPEMILTGYMFPNAAAIAPHLEHPQTGITSRFCAELAERLKCYVVAGYPEKLSSAETTNRGGNSLIGANSAILYDPAGQYVGDYRKTHLFHVDKTWAIAGTGFITFQLPSPLSNVSLGICMDLNPQTGEWTSAEGPYEVADYCLSKKTKVLVLLNAWLYSERDMEENSDKDPDDTYAWTTLNYWAQRLRPLWVKSESATDTMFNEEETIVVVCNRSGEEEGTVFAGSSAIFNMQRNSDRPKLLDMMTASEEGVRIWEVFV